MKKNSFIIKEHEPFIIEGKKGKYEIPAWVTLSADDVEELSKLNINTPPKERYAILKDFLLKVAPGLDKEGLGDMGYVQIYSAYETAQGLTVVGE
ncbi:MAG: hypothetical protein K5886_02820 [Lachnospiraceae bacterium]|nr:hypothetical protein [Lachnospiraceae bacterium]